MKGDGAAARPALSYSIGNDDTRYDIVNNGDALSSGDCRPNHASRTSVYVCRYTVGTDEGQFRGVVATALTVDRAGNALASAYRHAARLALDATAPAAPDGFTATALVGGVRLAWSDPSPADATIAKYQVRRKAGTDPWGSWEDVPGGAAARSRTVTGLMSGTAYRFQLRAVDAATNYGSYSAAGPATPLALGTGAPAPQSVASDWALVPKDSGNNLLVGPGGKFRLLFVTSGKTAATSTSISTYNAFVQDAANANATLRPFRSQFRALVSTATVDARDNTATTGTGVPIYWVQGAKVADDHADFYDGSWDSVAGKTESGGTVTRNAVPWTGSKNDGTKSVRPAGTERTSLGTLLGLSSSPISGGGHAESSRRSTLYALSPVLTRTRGTGDTTGPSVTGAPAITSLDGTYITGDDLEVTITFDEAIVVVGAPELKVRVGSGTGSEKTATCTAHASDDRKLVCTYTIASGDADADGVSVEANRLSVPGGASVKDANGNDATLTHAALPAQSAHKVDAVAPAITGLAMGSTPAAGGAYAAAEAVKVEVTFSRALDVSSDATNNTITLALKVGAADKDAVCAHKGGTGEAAKKLACSYTVADGDEDADGVSVDAGALTLNGTAEIYDSGQNNEAVVTHTGMAAQGGHKVDAKKPTVIAGSTGYFGNAAATTALAGPQKPGADIYTKVTFSEDMKHVKGDGAAARPALSYSIGNDDTRYDIVNNGDALSSGDCRPNHASRTSVYVCRYTVGTDEGQFRGVVATASTVDRAGNALASAYRHAARLALDATAPAAPGGFTATALVGGVRLAWSDPSPADATIAKYQVRRKAGTDPWGSWEDVPGGAAARSRTVTGLMSGTAYRFQLRAVDAATNYGSYSAAGPATPLALGTGAPAPQSVASDWALVPKDSGNNLLVGPGGKFRLLFVTSGQIKPTSAKISTYNAFVQNAANANATLRPFRSQFRALVSTATVDARDNTATTGAGVPIYWVQGAKVADDHADFYDGSWDSVAGKTETGASSTPAVIWTGSKNDGRKFTFQASGQTIGPAGSGSVRVGALSGGGVPISTGYLDQTATGHLYALSPVLTRARGTGDTTGPSVSGAPAITSEAGTYITGDDLEVTITFDEAIVVVGAPELKVRVGSGTGSEKTATCTAHATDDRKLVCTYTIASGDADADGVSVEANRLSVPGGASVKDANGNDATLTHAALPAQSAHKVDAVAPAITGLAMGSAPAAGGAYAAAEAVKVEVTFSRALDVSSDATNNTITLALKVGAADKDAVCAHKGGTGEAAKKLACSYTVADGDEDADGVSVDAGALTLNGTAEIYDSGQNNEAVVTHTGLAAQGGHRVDTTDPGIAFPSSPAVPRLGTASRIVLTDANAKIAKYGAIVVDGTTGAATDCDTAAEIGAGNVTTLSTPKASVDFDYTPPAGSTGKKVCAWAEDAAGNSDSKLWSAAVKEALPKVTGIAVTSSPAAGQAGYYRLDDTIAVTLTFDKALTVTGTPELRIKVWRIEETATCAKKGTSGEDAKKLVCSYTVAGGDEDTDGIEVQANKLSLPTTMPATTVRDSNGNDADLDHEALGMLSAHKVDGAVSPGISFPTARAQVGTASTITLDDSGSGIKKHGVIVVDGSTGTAADCNTAAKITAGGGTVTTETTALASKTISYTVPANSAGKKVCAWAEDAAGNRSSNLWRTTIAGAGTDTTRPTVTAASTGYFSDAAVMTALTAPQKGGANVYTKVTFSEDMKHVKSDGTSARPQLYGTLGGSVQVIYDILDNGDTLASGDCKPNHATSTNVYVCLYTVGPSVNGAFGLRVGRHSVDKADNALANHYNHGTTLTLDTTKPGIAFPESPARPQAGAASTITLTDAGAKIGKYGAIAVTSPGAATDCDTATEITNGGGTVTTETAPLASKAFAYTVPSDSSGKRVCAWAEDAAGNVRSQVWGEDIQAAAAKPARPTGLTATAGNAQVALSWTDPSDSSITKHQYRQKEGRAAWGRWTDIPTSAPGESNATSWTVTGLSNGTAHRFRIRAVNAQGNSRQSDVAGPVTPTASTPTVMPPGNAVWSATLTADESETFFGCDNDDEDQKNCSSSTVLTDDDFSYGGSTYTIQFVYWDSDADELSIGLAGLGGPAAKTVLRPLTLTVDGDPLAVTESTAFDNGLSWSYDPSPDWIDGQKVSLWLAPAADTTPPTVTANATGYFSDAALSSALTGAVKGGTSVYTKVTFSEDMKHVKDDGTDARPELFRRIGSTDTQYDILDNGDTLANGDCRPNHASETDEYVCLYTVDTSDSGTFTVKAGTGSVDKADNALAAVYTHAATLTLDTTAPSVPSALALASGTASPGNDATPDIEVTVGESGGTVTLYSDNACANAASAATAVTDTEAPFKVTVPATALAADGSVTFHATHTDAATNASACSTASVAYIYDGTDPGIAFPDGVTPTVGTAATITLTDATAKIAKHAVVEVDGTATDATGCDDPGGDSLTLTTVSPAASPKTVSYTPVTATKKICVYAEDAAGNSLGKLWTTAIQAAPVTPPANAVWSATLTVAPTSDNLGCDTGYSNTDGCHVSTTLTDDDFEYDNETYTILQIESAPSGNFWIGFEEPESSTIKELLSELTLTVKKGAATKSLAVADATSNFGGRGIRWSGANLGWSEDDTVELKLTEPAAATKPAKPTGLTATAGNAKVTLSWTDPGDSSITKHQYQQKAGAAAWDTTWTDIPSSAPGEANATSYTVTSLGNGTAYRFRIRAVNAQGNSPQSDVAGPATPSAADTTGPTVSSIAITSTVPANQDGKYRIGDAIKVTVTFNEAIALTGSPTLKIKVGTAEKSATCAKKGTTGDDAKKLVCSWTVAEGDADTDGIAVEAGKLSGTIKDGSDNAATLTYTAIPDSAGHKVDGIKPTVTQASTGYFSDADATTALAGPVKGGVNVYTKVTFSEDMKHVKDDGTDARPELFHRIGSTDVQYDILDSDDTLASGDCRPNHASETDEYVCLYTAGTSDSGTFTVKAGTNSVDKAGNALANAYTHATTLTLDNAAPSAPSALALASGTASPGNDATPDIEVTVGESGGTVTLYSNSACANAASAATAVTDTQSPYKVTVPATALADDGSVTFHAKHADAATNASACSTASVAYVYDGTDPGIAFPDGVTPTVGTAATITLTDATAKVAKHAVVEVDGTATDATGCDDPGADGFSTTAVSPAASPEMVSYTPVTATKKICVYAEDAAGNSDSELWTTPIAAANVAATGKPAITGTGTVGETLTAAKGTIADANGLTKADDGDAGYAYTYQWVRVDSDGSSNAADISGATSSTYVLVAADEGKKVKVRVAFKDDLGNAESRTSDAFPSAATVAAADGTAPTVTANATGYFTSAAATTALAGPLKSGADIYTKVTFSEDMKHVKSDAAAARPELFRRIGSTDVQYDIVDNADALASGDCRPADASETAVYVCRYTVGTSDNGAFRVKAGTNSVDKADNALAGVYTHAATLTLDNTAPTVTSSATGYYSDADATTALAGPVKGGASVYTKVTFSEDMRHVKGDAAAARPELFRRIGSTDVQYDILDSGDTLESGDCRPNHASETDEYVCRYTVGSSVNGTFTVKAGTGSADKAGNALANPYTHAATLTLDNTAPAKPSALALASGTASPGNDATPDIEATVGESGGTVTLHSDSACANAASAATDVTDTEAPYKVTVPATALTSDGSVTFHAKHADAATNDSACSTASVAYIYDGTDPGIAFPDGVTPTVGTAATITLTDATAKIAKYAVVEVDGTATDATGCDDPGADGFSTTAVSPAASPETVSYTPVTATKKICVYAEDAAGNSDSKLWTTAIQAANSAATGKPEITGTATVGETLTAAKGTIADANGLMKAEAGDAGYAYTYQWVRVDSDGSSNAADISGAASKTYTLVAADEGKKVKVRVAFKDDLGNAETRTSDAFPSSATVAAADSTAPSATFMAPASGWFKGGDTVTIDFKLVIKANAVNEWLTVYITRNRSSDCKGGRFLSGSWIYSDSLTNAARLTTAGEHSFSVDVPLKTGQDTAADKLCVTVTSTNTGDIARLPLAGFRYDGTNPEIAFPESPAVPQAGMTSTITLTDAHAKIRKYGAIVVDGATGTAASCDTEAEITAGGGTVTTETTPLASKDFSYTVPANSEGKKVCAWAEDAAGNGNSRLWSAARAVRPDRSCRHRHRDHLERAREPGRPLPDRRRDRGDGHVRQGADGDRHAEAEDQGGRGGEGSVLRKEGRHRGRREEAGVLLHGGAGRCGRERHRGRGGQAHGDDHGRQRRRRADLHGDCGQRRPQGGRGPAGGDGGRDGLLQRRGRHDGTRGAAEVRGGHLHEGDVLGGHEAREERRGGGAAGALPPHRVHRRAVRHPRQRRHALERGLPAGRRDRHRRLRLPLHGGHLRQRELHRQGRHRQRRPGGQRAGERLHPRRGAHARQHGAVGAGRAGAGVGDGEPRQRRHARHRRHGRRGGRHGDALQRQRLCERGERGDGRDGHGVSLQGHRPGHGARRRRERHLPREAHRCGDQRLGVLDGERGLRPRRHGPGDRVPRRGDADGRYGGDDHAHRRDGEGGEVRRRRGGRHGDGRHGLRRPERGQPDAHDGLARGLAGDGVLHAGDGHEEDLRLRRGRGGQQRQRAVDDADLGGRHHRPLGDRGAGDHERRRHLHEGRRPRGHGDLRRGDRRHRRAGAEASGGHGLGLGEDGGLRRPCQRRHEAGLHLHGGVGRRGHRRGERRGEQAVAARQRDHQGRERQRRDADPPGAGGAERAQGGRGGADGDPGIDRLLQRRGRHDGARRAGQGRGERLHQGDLLGGHEACEGRRDGRAARALPPHRVHRHPLRHPRQRRYAGERGLPAGRRERH